jgi:hypothetical protein
VTNRFDVLIQDRETGEYVPAVLIDGVSAEEVNAAESLWQPVVEREKKRMVDESVPVHLQPEHMHWDWRRKHQRTDGLLVYQMLGIECEDQIQGLMLLKTAGVFSKAPGQLNAGILYIHFLATAPWNSPTVVKNPRYKYVGTVLLRAAIETSIDLGFKGRVGLHSLPQSELWYSKNMNDLGIDGTNNLRYFEMTADQAQEFMR